MEIAFQQRRQQILGECRQLKTDVDNYKDNYNSGEQLQAWAGCIWPLPLQLTSVQHSELPGKR